MNNKQFRKNLMESIESDLNNILNERKRIGFAGGEIEDRKIMRPGIDPDENGEEGEEPGSFEDMLAKQLSKAQLAMKIKSANFKIFTDRLAYNLESVLPNNSEVLRIDEDKIVIICKTLQDYITILKHMDGKYDSIQCEAMTEY